MTTLSLSMIPSPPLIVATFDQAFDISRLKNHLRIKEFLITDDAREITLILRESVTLEDVAQIVAELEITAEFVTVSVFAKPLTF